MPKQDLPEISDQRLRELMRMHTQIMRLKTARPELRSMCCDTVLALSQLLTMRDTNKELSQCINTMVARTMDA